MSLPISAAGFALPGLVHTCNPLEACITDLPPKGKEQSCFLSESYRLWFAACAARPMGLARRPNQAERWLGANDRSTVDTPGRSGNSALLS